uniref:Uncharacterized protein n=1 Tax=viral metagenome TaxID=1070528 RepID=A0A6M3KH85_9ZZZZ
MRNKFRSNRRCKFESLCQLLRRHSLEAIRHYACIEQCPRTLRAAAITVLRERHAS